MYAFAFSLTVVQNTSINVFYKKYIVCISCGVSLILCISKCVWLIQQNSVLPMISSTTWTSKLHVKQIWHFNEDCNRKFLFNSSVTNYELLNNTQPSTTRRYYYVQHISKELSWRIMFKSFLFRRPDQFSQISKQSENSLSCFFSGVTEVHISKWQNIPVSVLKNIFLFNILCSFLSINPPFLKDKQVIKTRSTFLHSNIQKSIIHIAVWCLFLFTYVLTCMWCIFLY